MLKQGLVITLGIAFVSLLVFGFKKELRKIYYLNDDFSWNIEIINEKTAYEKEFRSQQWESWELVLLGVAASIAIATISWSMYTLLQTLEGKRSETTPNEQTKDLMKVAVRVTQVEQSLADLISNMARLSESLDKLGTMPVETLYARPEPFKENGNHSLLTNDDDVSSQNMLNTGVTSTPKTENAAIGVVEAVNEECRDSPRSAERSPPVSRPDTPFSDPLSWYQETETERCNMDQETVHQSKVVQSPDPCNCVAEYEGKVDETEVTVSEPLPLPVGCGESGRGQAKRIPQYQGSRRNLRSRGRESPETSPRKEQSTPGDSVTPRRKTRGYSQRF